MRTLVTGTAFRKDLNRVLKRGYDAAKLAMVIEKLQREEALPPSNINGSTSRTAVVDTGRV